MFLNPVWTLPKSGRTTKMLVWPPPSSGHPAPLCRVIVRCFQRCWEKMIPYLLGLNSNCYFAHTPVACTIGPSVNCFTQLIFLSKSIFCNLIKFMMKKWLKIQCLHHHKSIFFQIVLHYILLTISRACPNSSVIFSFDLNDFSMIYFQYSIISSP
jgi:hypothetical protein